MKKREEMGRALVVGSVAFDVVFDVHGTIRERITISNGKLDKQNLMFVSKEKQQRFGGTGANISYGLGLLGVKPVLFSTVGKDFTFGFQKHLENRGVDLQVHVVEDGWTATFYGMSDAVREQIGVWQPNAHDVLETVSVTGKLSKKTLADVTVAIFSPGTPLSISKHMAEVRKALGKRVTLIFDPGQVTPFFSLELLKKCFKLADIIIVNDTELLQIETTCGMTREELFGLGGKVLIETKGEHGSVIYQKGKDKRHVGAISAPIVSETTGAGDAYRAGLMYGLLNGFDILRSCGIGSYVGSKSVETYGAQTYSISQDDIGKL